MGSAEANGAIEHIHRDLDGIRRRRRVALGGYLALLIVFALALALAPAPLTAFTRNARWGISLIALFVASTLGTGLALGVPFVRSRAAFFGLSGLAGATLVGGLLGMVEWAPLGSANLATGAKCFWFGTILSSIAMVALGVASARMWRRFPDPGLPAAIGLTAVGVMALHFRCGGSDMVHLLGFHLAPVLVVYGVARATTRARDARLES